MGTPLGYFFVLYIIPLAVISVVLPAMGWEYSSSRDERFLKMADWVSKGTVAYSMSAAGIFLFTNAFKGSPESVDMILFSLLWGMVLGLISLYFVDSCKTATKRKAKNGVSDTHEEASGEASVSEEPVATYIFHKGVVKHLILYDSGAHEPGRPIDEPVDEQVSLGDILEETGDSDQTQEDEYAADEKLLMHD